jgi:pilus assembly protein CpaF
MIPQEVFNETLLGFLAPIRHYLDDKSVTEVMINGHQKIYVERKGKLQRVGETFPSNEALLSALRNIAQYAGKQLDELHPILEGRLPDGSRVQAVVPPVSYGGVSVAIRRFSPSMYTMPTLIQFGALTEDCAMTLAALVHSKLNVIVAGGTGSGKTSMLNTLSRSIPEDERVVVIEDSKEVQLQQEHVVYLEARPPDPKGRGAVTIRDLFRTTLRMRPDRIVIGEIRGGEALDIVQAMVSGHGGCMGTLHATYPRDTMTRLETMAMMSDVEIPLAALRLQIASGINIILQVARLHDGSRKVTHVSEVVGYDLATMKYQIQDLFIRKWRADGEDRSSTSELVPTGIMPQCLEQLHEHGTDLPEGVYEAVERRRAEDAAVGGVIA